MTLRTRITLVAIAVTLLVAISLIVTSQVSQGQVEARFAEATTTGKSVLWRKIVASQLDKMAAGTSSLARDRATRDALVKRDVAALAESAKTSYNLLEAQGIVTKLQITDLDGGVLFSAPDGFTGKTRKTLVGRAISEKLITRGLERDDDGRMVVVVAFPLLKRGQPVGAGVFVRDLQDAIADFKLNDESDVLIVDGKGTELYATEPGMFAKLKIDLPELGSSSIQVAKVGELIDSVAVLPIMNAADQPIAHLVSVKDFTASYQAQGRFNTIAYTAIAAVIALSLAGLYWYMQRSLKPLQKVAEVLRNISEGDLGQKIEVTSNDEIGALQKAMKAMVEQLRDMLGSINGMTEKLAGSAGDMTRIADEVSQGVQQQQSQTDQVATAMNEMTATVQEVARHAEEAAGAATNADSQAADGNRVVSATISAINKLAEEVEQASGVIHKLEQDSENIGAVLTVIKSIAEQTNLLALNAAIEAARAGEQGRGFAVVADEVRTLASRTQKSTEEIESMIEKLQQGARNAVTAMDGSRNRAQTGVDQAAQAGKTLSSITEAVATITHMNNQIATAANEQSAVAEEINRSIVGISEVAEMSAHSAVQTATATDELSALAVELRGLVNRFRL